MIALLVLTVLAGAQPPTVDVSVLESQKLRRVRINRSEVDAQTDGELAFPPRRWTIEAGAIRRTYEGALSVTATNGKLKIVVRAPLESYVAGVVAAESAPGTPPAALQALAVVVRSYALAKHAGPLCDLASCQIFHGVIKGRQGDDARDAAAATAGVVLRLADGTIAGATFHASCGGHTADPREIFGGVERTGARAISDLDDPSPWTARVSETDWRRGVREAFGDPFLVEEPTLVRGAGDRIVQLSLMDGRHAAADALVRALDRARGRGVIRSARFSIRRDGTDVVLTGTGHGHGVGLCQAGAALRAARGDTFEAILRAYFPAATLGSASFG